MTPYRTTRRDRLAHWLANRTLRLATPEYRAFLYVTHRLGMAELDRKLGIERPQKEGT